MRPGADVHRATEPAAKYLPLMDAPLPFHPLGAAPETAYALRGRRPDVLEDWDRHVIVDVVHDGACIPPTLTPLFGPDGQIREDVRNTFIRERDWGASAVAESLASHLGLRGYQTAETARVVCDFNRFRGRTVPEAGHLGRRGLFGPTAELLPGDLGEQALTTCYDPVSAAMFARAAEAFEDTRVGDSRLLRITVHTYDDRVGEGHRRPKASLIFTPFEYHETARLPAGVYPPVFPDRLAEFTADRALAYRMALMLEKNYVPVAVNSPYFLPLGGSEMRLQVWCYIQHLRQQVERVGTGSLPQDLTALWPVLEAVDTPWGGSELTAAYRALLERLTQFIKANEEETVHHYRYSAFRPNAIEVEVRKDLIWKGAWQTLSDGAEAFVPEEDGLRVDQVERIAAVMAAGVREYLTVDQPQKRAGARPQ